MPQGKLNNIKYKVLWMIRNQVQEDGLEEICEDIWALACDEILFPIQNNIETVQTQVFFDIQEQLEIS